MASRRIVVSCLGCFVLAIAAVSAAPAEMLTLAQAVREALIHNERTIDDRDRLEQANLAVHLAKNAFRPKIVPNIQGSFGQTDVSNQNYRVDVTQRLTTGTQLQAGVGASTAQIPSAVAGEPDIRYYNADTTFELSQPLLRGLGPTVTRRAEATALLQQADAGRQVERGEQELAVEVASAYYRVVAARSLREVGAKSVERAHKLVEASRARLEAGNVSQLDVLRAEELASQADLQMADVEAAIDDAHDQLTFLMGRSPDSTFDVASDIPLVTSSLTPDEAVATALDRRSDLKSLIDAAGDSRNAIAFAKNQLLPQLDVNLLFTRRDTARTLADSFRVGRFQFATFLAVSMPVDRTPEIVDYQNAIIERDRRDRAVETLRRTITNDITRAIRERDRLRRTLAVAEAGVDIAKKEIEVAEFRYQRGLSSNLDLVDAESALLAAESRRLSVLADAAVEELRLRALIGVLDPRSVEAPALP